MPLFHYCAKIVSRGKGQSAIAAAAYRSGDRLRDEATGELKEYKARRERIVSAFLMVPTDAPEWAKSRNDLWNRAEQSERRCDAQLAREVEVALPHELTPEQREWLVRDFAREEFVRKGYAVDIAIHAPDKKSDERNHHAHLLITRRTLTIEGFSKTKDWKFDKTQLAREREKWAHLMNRHLERHGHAERVDHRSLKAQGIEREAGIHLGYAAHKMMQRGEESDRAGILEAIQTSNRLKEEIRFADVDLRALEGQREQAQKDAVRETARASAEPEKDEEQGERKERPELWADDAGMAAQQRSAMRFLKRHEREAPFGASPSPKLDLPLFGKLAAPPHSPAERVLAKRHSSAPPQGEKPLSGPDMKPKEASSAPKKKLRFFEDGAKDRDSPPEKEKDGRLSFYEDKKPDRGGRDR